MKVQTQKSSFRQTSLRILCIGAHPDDLEIGMGGTIARHTNLKDKVLMAVSMVPNAKKERLIEVKKAAKILGAESVILDLDLDHKILTREIISVFDNLLLDYKPQIIYTHWNHDSHQDHHIISQAVLSATRHNQCDVYMFEQIIPGGIMPYSFRAQKIVDISKYINSKVLSLKAHKSQMKKNKYDWIVGIRGRASQWGYTIGVKYAEAFEVVKIIEK